MGRKDTNWLALLPNEKLSIRPTFTACTGPLLQCVQIGIWQAYMKIVNPDDKKQNWHEVLSTWNRVVNWSHYKFSDKQIKEQLKPLIIYLWNEKDWMMKRYPEKSEFIEEFVNQSTFIKVIADLANTLKHGELPKRSRSDFKQADYFGQVSFSQNKSRRMYYIETNGKLFELFEILRGAIDEYQELDCQCKY
jgi:hypothetical protein